MCAIWSTLSAKLMNLGHWLMPCKTCKAWRYLLTGDKHTFGLQRPVSYADKSSVQLGYRLVYVV